VETRDAARRTIEGCIYKLTHVRCIMLMSVLLNCPHRAFVDACLGGVACVSMLISQMNSLCRVSACITYVRAVSVSTFILYMHIELLHA